MEKEPGKLLKLNPSKALLIVFLLTACDQQEPIAKQSSNAQTGGVFQTTCATCHGESGQGVREKMTPAIASLPRWYLEEQITKFRNGQRGAHPEDVNGQVMRATISALSEEQIAEALNTVEELPFPNHEATLSGDIANGAILYRENCMECHRFNGRGEVAFRSSPVAGLQDWYLLAQWKKFAQGIRGYHPDDESGAKMRKATEYLTDDQEIKDIMHYISSLSEEK